MSTKKPETETENTKVLKALTFEEQNQARAIYKKIHKGIRRANSVELVHDYIEKIPSEIRGWRVEVLVRVAQEQIKYLESLD